MVISKFKLVILVITVLVVNIRLTVFAQNTEKAPKIRATATPLQTTIGKEILYKVSIATALKDIEILLPEEKHFYLKVEENNQNNKDKIPDEKEEVKKDSEDEEIKDAKKKIPLYIIQKVTGEDNSDKVMLYKTIIMKVVYYHVGTYSLPEIKFKDSAQNFYTYNIPQVTINALNKTAQMENIEPPIALKGNYTRLILVIIGAVVFGIIIVVLVLFIRKRMEIRKSRVIVRPPGEIFIEEIKKLKKANYLEKDDVDSFVVTLSMIFRKYIKLTLKFDAVDMTNEEIFRTIRKSKNIKLSVENFEKLCSLMNLWDLSKFAEFTPSHEILIKNLEDTEDFVLKQNWNEVIQDV